MSKKQKRKSPSREKYDKEKPVESFRVFKTLDDRLEEVKRTTGKSNADIMAIGVGLLEVKVENENKIQQKAYDDGWENGNEEAYDLYAVTYPCSECKKEMVVFTDEEKKAIRKFIIANRWHHIDCDDPLN